MKRKSEPAPGPNWTPECIEHYRIGALLGAASLDGSARKIKGAFNAYKKHWQTCQEPYCMNKATRGKR